MFWLPLVSAKKSPRLMRPAASAVAASRPLARAIARPRSTTSLKGVSEACASAGGACMTRNSARVLLDQRLDVGVEVGRRHAELVGPADARRQRVGEVLVGAHHLDAGEVDGLPRQVRQRLLGIDLRAPLGEDRLEVAQRLVVGGAGGGLLFGEGGGLGRGGRHEARTAGAGSEQGHGKDRGY